MVLVQGSAMPDPKMMCPGTCEYKMTVDMSWSPASHPIDFPKDPKGFVFPFWTVAHNKKCADRHPLPPARHSVLAFPEHPSVNRQHRRTSAACHFSAYAWN